jgi:hypothetical protein
VVEVEVDIMVLEVQVAMAEVVQGAQQLVLLLQHVQDRVVAVELITELSKMEAMALMVL